MKLKRLTIGLFLLVIILVSSQFKTSVKYESGPPAGVTGSPGDGVNCTNCHSGSAASALNLITSDIPATGYIPGATYNVTTTVSHATFNKFGFQVSPQSSTGVQKGTLIVSDATRTQLTGSGKYIMHKTAGTAGTANTDTWEFKWKAPASGSGNFTFYGAFVKANANGQSSGDAVVVSQLAVTEDLSVSVGIKDNSVATEEWKLYPMPCTNEVNISLVNNASQKVRIMIRSLEGKIIMEDVLVNNNGILKLPLSGLSTGIYLLTVFEPNRSVTKKLIKL